MNSREFILNCNAHTAEEMAPYFEQHVAWSVDGKKILAHAKDLADLYKEVDRLGLSEYVISFVPDPNVVDLGGALLS